MQTKSRTKPLVFGELPSYERLVKEHQEILRKLKNARLWIEAQMGPELALRILETGGLQK